jgi:hypothetical protein
MTPTRLRGVRDAVGRRHDVPLRRPVGHEAIRFASGMIRIYNPVQKVQVFGALSAVDFGDAPTAPGYIEHTLAGSRST